jgi:hypothetical protein
MVLLGLLAMVVGFGLAYCPASFVYLAAFTSRLDERSLGF